MQQNNRPYEGFFITIEGGEGAGKTTFSGELARALTEKGHTVLKTREPGGSPLSECLRELILNPAAPFAISDKAELLLFLAARAQHLEERILPALHRGEIVICERFNDSSIAYQGCARHLGMKYVQSLCKLVAQEPDRTLFLDLNPEEGMKRIKDKKKLDRLEQEEIQFHQEVRQGFLHLADAHPERIVVLDASLPTSELVQLAQKALMLHA